MLNVIVENKYGEQLRLTNNESYYTLSVSGLTPPTATINTSIIATKDGSAFNSSRLNNRNIVLMIAPLNSIESSRINLYKYFKSKQYVKLYISNETRNVWIEGFVESIEGDLFTMSETIQISIICPEPYFKSVDVDFYTFSNAIGAFAFPFSIAAAGVPISTISDFTEVDVVNASDDETGVIIELIAGGTVLEPTIWNMTTNESFTVEYEMQAGDVITINTRPGEKSIKVLRNGVETNILNNMARGSKWLNLIVGDNIFAYSALFGNEDLTVNVTLQTIYEGM